VGFDLTCPEALAGLALLGVILLPYKAFSHVYLGYTNSERKKGLKRQN